MSRITKQEKDKKFQDLANRIVFIGIKESELLEEFKYRKNKGIDDIRNAVSKGISYKYGRGKTELELEWVALFLSDVLLVK